MVSDEMTRKAVCLRMTYSQNTEQARASSWYFN